MCEDARATCQQSTGAWPKLGRVIPPWFRRNFFRQGARPGRFPPCCCRRQPRPARSRASRVDLPLARIGHFLVCACAMRAESVAHRYGDIGASLQRAHGCRGAMSRTCSTDPLVFNPVFNGPERFHSTATDRTPLNTNWNTVAPPAPNPTTQLRTLGGVPGRPAPCLVPPRCFGSSIPP